MNDARSCRACGGAHLRGIYRVDRVPVHSCLMVDTRAEALSFPCGDVDLAFCEECGFIQNRRFDPSLQAYSPAYEELQFFSPRFRRFLAEVCDDQASRHALGGKTVLEIGCGKGEFLAALCERAGCSGIGIDPESAGPWTARPRRGFTSSRTSTGRPTPACRPTMSAAATLEHIGDVADFMRLVRKPMGDRTDIGLRARMPSVS